LGKNNLKKSEYFDEISEIYNLNFKNIKSGKNFEFRKRAQIINSLIGNSGSSIIDLGCGNGSIIEKILQNHKEINQVTLIDYSKNMLRLAKKKLIRFKIKKKFIKKDIFQIYLKGKADIVLCVGVLGHVINSKKLIFKISQLIKKDGTLLIQYTKKKHFFSIVYRMLLFMINKKSETYFWHNEKNLNKELLNKNFVLKKKINYKIGIPFLDLISPKLNYLLEKNLSRLSLLVGTEVIALYEYKKKE
jgi:ubiquinone/menaquinone biosynthesis C-methylase UbiE